jgi:hypothetical protein
MQNTSMLIACGLGIDDSKTSDGSVVSVSAFSLLALFSRTGMTHKPLSDLSKTTFIAPHKTRVFAFS